MDHKVHLTEVSEESCYIVTPGSNDSIGVINNINHVLNHKSFGSDVREQLNKVDILFSFE